MTPGRRQILAYRLAINHLSGDRLPLEQLAEAAGSGLQDGSPRSGLLSLAARVAGIEPETWRDDRLVQVFGPRGAVYLVPRSDATIFTMGLLPRDPVRVAELTELANRIHDVLRGAAQSQRTVVARLGHGNARLLRWAACTGTLHAVWDTRDTLVVPVAAPQADAESCRLELGRRFFRYLGPATVAELRWWLDASAGDARTTAQALHGELVDLGGGRWLHESGADALRHAPAASGVRLLPPEDTYIARTAQAILVSDPAGQRRLWPQAPPPGALVIDGEVAATWRRRVGRVVVTPWRAVTQPQLPRSSMRGRSGPPPAAWSGSTPRDGGVEPSVSPLSCELRRTCP